MHFSNSITLLAALAASVSAAPSSSQKAKRTLPATSGNLDLIAKLVTAPTQADRIALLPNDNDFTFDFLNAPTSVGNSTGMGGSSVRADRKTMPGLIGTGSSMVLGFLGPCGMNTPHTHPRGTELNIVVQGRLMTNFILENGARVVTNLNGLYQMVVFPQGALHQEFNPDCEPAVFVAAFNSEDAGTQQTADNLFRLPNDVLKASFGDIVVDGRDLDLVKDSIPANVALGVQECLDKCGIKKRTYSK